MSEIKDDPAKWPMSDALLRSLADYPRTYVEDAAASAAPCFTTDLKTGEVIVCIEYRSPWDDAGLESSFSLGDLFQFAGACPDRAAIEQRTKSEIEAILVRMFDELGER